MPEGCGPLAMDANVDAEFAHAASGVHVAVVSLAAFTAKANPVNVRLGAFALPVLPWDQLFLVMGRQIDELGFEGAERTMLARIMLVDDDDSCVPAKVAAKPFDGS